MLKKSVWLAVVMLVSVPVVLSGCSETPTGSVGIVKTRGTGYISKHVVGQGLHMVVLHSVTNIDVTQTRAEVQDMHPKDEKGVQLKDVSVVVEYSLNPKRVAAFYIATKEIEKEPGTPYRTIGLDILDESAIPYAVQLATENSNPETIASHLETYAKTIHTNLNVRLHKLYPKIDPFIINSVTVPTFDLPTSIQHQVDAKAGYQAELLTIEAEKKVIDQRKTLVDQQTNIQAGALASAAKTTGLTPEEIIQWEKARGVYQLDNSGNTPHSIVVMQAADK